MIFFQFLITCKKDNQCKQRYLKRDARQEKTKEFQTQLLHYFSVSNNKSNHFYRFMKIVSDFFF